MKTMTLKLTKEELNTITEIIKDDVDYLNSTTTYYCAGITLPKWGDKGDFVNVVNVDKFREFLKSMTINFTNCQELINYNMANSLLTKLNTEVA